MPKLSLALDSTQMVAYQFCPQAWKWGHLDRLGPRGAGKKALDKGTVMHHLLEVYYDAIMKNEPQPELIAKRSFTDKWRENPNAFGQFTKDELSFLLKRFIEYVSCAEEFDGQIIGVEKGFSIVIHEDADHLFILEGKIDLLLSSRGKTIVVDHKTRSRSDSYNYKYAPQFNNYALATSADYVIVNYIGLQDKAGDFQRTMSEYDAEKHKRWHNYILGIFRDAAIDIRCGEYEKKLSSCGAGKYGKCEFTPVCEETDARVQAAQLQQLYQIKEDWKPWS